MDIRGVVDCVQMLSYQLDGVQSCLDICRIFAYDSCRVFARCFFMRSRRTLRDRVEARIARKGDDVFLPREFADLGGQDQVLRALRELVREGRLIRLGYGVYGRAERSKLSGQPILAARDGFVGASRAALTKLGVEWEPAEWERAYNEGRSTQVPANAVVRVKSRFARRLGYRGHSLVLER